MNETLTTVRGTIVSDPRVRIAGEETVISLRLACNNRFQDRETKEWRTSSTLYLTVNCWGRLATSIGGRLVLGDGVIVQGRLSSNEYEHDGQKRNNLEMRAVAIGADMARADVAITRRAKVTSESGATGSSEDEKSAAESSGSPGWDVNSAGRSGGSGASGASADAGGSVAGGELVGAGTPGSPPF